MQREAGVVNALITAVPVAPLLAEPTLRSEQVSQLVLGEAAEISARQGDMVRVRTLLDGYHGWLAIGYALTRPLAEAEAWIAGAGWSEGALLASSAGVAVRAPHRARLRLHDGDVFLPTGERCDILAGAVRLWPDVIADTVRDGPAEWAWREFAGTPYLWGGVTGAGIDCSGLVQTTFLARGVVLPRDAQAQEAIGTVVSVDARRPGDLLFFRASDGDRINHVAILDTDQMIVHSTIDTGGVIREPLAAGARAAPLLARLAAVRRVP